MAGLVLMIVALGVILFFKSLGKKKERWPGEHRIQADFNRSAALWNASDVGKRVIILRRVHSGEDEQLFQAYVQAPWKTLPEKVQLQLMAAFLVYQDNPEFFK